MSDIHVVRHGLIKTKSDGSIMPSNATIKDMLTFNTEDRILVDAGIPNSVGNPTVKEYLELEDSSGYVFLHMDQTYIITRLP